jgi:hypothetical protein
MSAGVGSGTRVRGCGARARWTGGGVRIKAMSRSAIEQPHGLTTIAGPERSPTMAAAAPSEPTHRAR